ncbi:hypothetical protein P2L35_13295 [Enterococcus faecium]|nr:hypothetical protein [Enterococcus faecium]
MDRQHDDRSTTDHIRTAAFALGFRPVGTVWHVIRGFKNGTLVQRGLGRLHHYV